MPKACQRQWFDSSAPYLFGVMLMHDYDENEQITQPKLKAPHPLTKARAPIAPS